MRIVVFTDLDGTLLDHNTYSHAPAEPALAELRRRGIPLVLASSKTAAEVEPLHQALDLGDTPAIVENGAGVLVPGAVSGGDAPHHASIREALRNLPGDLAARFRGFGDMATSEIAAATGLSEKAASRARQRRFSEPGLWSGSDGDLTRFLGMLSDQGITARQGGRFLTLSHGRTKADAMREVTKDLGADVTIALGDAPNDAEMLQAADHGVIIRNDHAPPMPHLSAEAVGRIRRTERPGPEGWNEAVLELLHDIDGT